MYKHQEYPKWLYHKEKSPVVVHTAEAHEALGDGWEHSPAYFEVKSEKVIEETKSTSEEKETNRNKKKKSD